MRPLWINRSHPCDLFLAYRSHPCDPNKNENLILEMDKSHKVKCLYFKQPEQPLINEEVRRVSSVHGSE